MHMFPSFLCSTLSRKRRPSPARCRFLEVHFTVSVRSVGRISLLSLLHPLIHHARTYQTVNATTRTSHAQPLLHKSILIMDAILIFRLLLCERCRNNNELSKLYSSSRRLTNSKQQPNSTSKRTRFAPLGTAVEGWTIESFIYFVVYTQC